MVITIIVLFILSALTQRRKVKRFSNSKLIIGIINLADLQH